jgi:hypothetical protein
MWSAIGGFSEKALKDSIAPYRRWTKRMMRDGRFIGWIAEDDGGRPVGSGAIWLTDTEANNEW